MSANLTLSDLAQVANDAERALLRAHGDAAPPLPWQSAPDWQRAAVRNDVALLLAGRSPAEIHNERAHERRREGWVFAKQLNVAAKMDPMVAEWVNLDEELRQRALLLAAVVDALAPWVK